MESAAHLAKLRYARIAIGASPRRGVQILVRRLKLTNFRNYPTLDLGLGPGVTLIEGPNGHGKSNMLEAVYMMSAGKSLRASTDRDLVRSAAFDDIFTHAQVATEITTSSGDVRLQVDLAEPAPSESDALASHHRAAETVPRISKRFRINGVPRRASDFVGVLKAVLFSAEDLEFTSGPPSIRRRYADMLVSQLDSGYVREAQEYQRVMTQRNHLLKSIREGRSNESELEFWDVQLSVHAAQIMEGRARAIRALSAAACPIHETLSGSGEPLSVTYLPSVEPGDYPDARELSRTVLAAILAERRREVAAGHCIVGPHRDDITVSIGEMDVRAFGSRGQSRTAVLAMKLGEVDLIADEFGEQPVVLLDDVMSELDEVRRRCVVDRASTLDQVIVTNAEPNVREVFSGLAVRTITVRSGSVISDQSPS